MKLRLNSWQTEMRTVSELSVFQITKIERVRSGKSDVSQPDANFNCVAHGGLIFSLLMRHLLRSELFKDCKVALSRSTSPTATSPINTRACSRVVKRAQEKSTALL